MLISPPAIILPVLRLCLGLLIKIPSLVSLPAVIVSSPVGSIPIFKKPSSAFLPIEPSASSLRLSDLILRSGLVALYIPPGENRSIW